MKHWFDKKSTFASLIVFLYCALAGAKESSNLKVIERHIDSYQLETARDELLALTDEQQNSAEGKYVRGKFAFFGGNYKKANSLLNDAIQKERTELDWKYLRDQVEISRRHSASLKNVTPGKGISFYYRNNNDALLVPYAMDTLQKQQKKLKGVLGDTASAIRVYIVPSVEMLSDLCGLSTEQIEATGTVAISKYNRIMILSPRLIVGGYPWLDTLAHELTHMAITRVTDNRAPIWLHEGIAKLLEAQWRNVNYSDLTPVLAYLLDQATREKRLIPLRRFHPSVSYLPNQEDAALAYAQGLSFLRFVTGRFRDDNSLKTLLKLSARMSLDDAFAATTGYDINQLFRWWQKSLPATQTVQTTLVPLMQRRFKSGEGPENAYIDPILGREVRRHIRVGDLLRIRGHIEAAQKEYEWALHKNEIPTTDIVDRLASTLLARDQAERALELLNPMKKLYPNHSTVFLQAGEAQTKLGRQKEAEQDLLVTIALNPFHADAHCMLSAIFEDRGLAERAKIEKNACIQLNAAPQD
ncbi:MAG: hypothetical protein JXR76_02760 [Deltaproteobacteria bacterium]|nr:hypothetical protein [Deltaproteobacteria bacterium]